MRRVKDDTADMPGQDSFLDVVTNIVGILILLVVVMGVRTAGAVKEGVLQTDVSPTITPVDESQLQKAYQAAMTTEGELRDLMRTAIHVKQETELREQERSWLSTVVAAAKQELKDHRAELDGTQRRDFDTRRKLLAAQKELDRLTREQVSTLSQIPDVEEIEIPPTPLSKLASGKEIHLQLKKGHLAIVPVDEILEQIKTDVAANVWRLQKHETFANRLEPIGGFRVRYRIRRHQYHGETASGLTGTGFTARLAAFELIPEASPMGEPLADALLPDSELMRHIRRHPPDNVTVTIWTYADSFGDYTPLRKQLYELGYTTAGRPMPDGVLIGGSPHGKRTFTE